MKKVFKLILVIAKSFSCVNKVNIETDKKICKIVIRTKNIFPKYCHIVCILRTVYKKY